MSELGDVRAAAHEALLRRITLRGVMRMWRIQSRINIGFKRWTSSKASGKSFAAGRFSGPPRPDQEEHVVAVAVHWPDHFRIDGKWLSWSEAPTLTVIARESWMTGSAEKGARSNYGHPRHGHGNPALDMLNPAPLLRSDLSEIRTVQAVGRPAWQLVASPRDRRSFHTSARWAWEHCIDDYLVEVDRETGLVINLTGRVDRQDAVRYAFDRLETGVELDPELFSLTPPDGSQPVDVRSPREMPLERAAAEAKFKVFTPTLLPEFVSLESLPLFVGDTLVMHFGRPDRPRVLTLWQRPAPDRADPAWKPLTVGDQTVELHGDGLARLVRDGTEVVIRGELPPETLLHVLVSVVPTSPEPPLPPK